MGLLLGELELRHQAIQVALINSITYSQDPLYSEDSKTKCITAPALESETPRLVSQFCLLAM